MVELIVIAQNEYKDLSVKSVFKIKSAKMSDAPKDKR